MILRQVGTTEAAILVQIRRGITPTADAPCPGGLEEEDIVGGNGGRTIRLRHPPGTSSSVGATEEGKGKGGGGRGGGRHTTSGKNKDGLQIR